MSDLFGNEKPPVSNALLAVYDSEYRKHNDNLPAPIVGKKDGPNAARLLKRYPIEFHREWMQTFFVMRVPFIQQSGHAFGIYVSCLAQIIAHHKRTRVAVIERQPVSQNVLDIQKQVRAEWGS